MIVESIMYAIVRPTGQIAVHNGRMSLYPTETGAKRGLIYVDDDS